MKLEYRLQIDPNLRHTPEYSRVQDWEQISALKTGRFFFSVFKNPSLQNN